MNKLRILNQMFDWSITQRGYVMCQLHRAQLLQNDDIVENLRKVLGAFQETITMIENELAKLKEAGREFPADTQHRRRLKNG